MKKKCYIDAGGWHPDLKHFADVVEFRYFPYENKNKNCVPSEKASYNSWSEIDIPWNKFGAKFNEIYPSDKCNKIEKICKYRKDALHLDTVCRNSCNYFLTSDDRDIVRNKEVLEALLNLKIFNSHKELLLIKVELGSLQK